MKKFLFLCICVILLPGCATYKYSKGKVPDENGYVVSRDETAVLEYTVGPQGQTPEDLDLAKERFARRKAAVEYYYKQMGKMESRFQQTFINWPKFLLGVVTGPFRMPFAARQDYKYEHYPEYRKKVQEKEAREEAMEQARIKELQGKLNKYIMNDLEAEEYADKKFGKRTKAEPKKQPVVEEIIVKEEILESPKSEEIALVEKEEEAIVAEPVKEIKTEPELEKQQIIPLVEETQKIEKQEVKLSEPPKVKVKPAPKPKPAKEVVAVPGPKAFIMAKPIKGYSPLKVHFWGSKSFSPQGRIVSYLWDFGDGDTSKKMNPVNTFYSSTSEPKQFEVILTVQDNKGQASTANLTIEVLNK